jgi:DNA-binding transcriptional MerR regulator/effector-binding domain-containing protein
MFKIGDFSRLARVTIRTLHHYDETGLLQPAHVDMQTGYRYYTAEQLLSLQRILLLRDLGFSLDDIRYLTRATLSPEEFTRLLEVRRNEIAAGILQEEARLRRLDALRAAVLGIEGDSVAAITLRELPAIAVYAVRERVPVLGRVQRLFETAETEVARARLRADASPFLIFHDQDYREQDVDVEVCIPVSRTTDDPRTKSIPAASMACATYAGSYEQTVSVYGSMLRWFEHSALAIGGPLREVYHRFGAEQVGYTLPAHVLASSPADYVTELQVPVAPRSTKRTST